MKKENNGRNSTEKKDDGAIRLLVPIKSFEHGATVQDILFANKDLPFESITFLHVIENDVLDTPAYTHTDDGTILAAYRPGSMEDERPALKGLKYLAPVKKEFTPHPEKSFDEEVYLAQCLQKEKDLAEKRKKDRFGWLFVSLKKNEKAAERKIKNIQNDILLAEKHLNDGAYGDAIFTDYPSELGKRFSSLEILGVTLALDPSRNLAKNAELFYKRAKKAKTAYALSTGNLAKAIEEQEEAASALLQLQSADEEGLETLAKELDLLPPKGASSTKKEKTWHGLSSDSLPYTIDFHGTKILFGKSAKQNDCLSFLFDTAKSHYWFHVAGGVTGSHVMIKKENPSEEEIRCACEVALLNSALDDGDVIVALHKDIRKGAVMGQAIVKNFKTVHLSHISTETRNLLAGARKIQL
jgi:predicted ribosome quality control (RQC) complex YloA/Tae2 family protein